MSIGITAAIERVLKRFGWISSIEKDDLINASIENSKREFDTVLGKMREALAKKNGSVAHLRESIQNAKERTHAFEDFEKLTVRRNGRSNGAS